MNQDVLIRLPEVKRLTKLSRSTIYGNMKKGLFPKQYKPSPGVSAWKKSEIKDLINGNWHA
ncbi:MAG: AlpA family phage regulatory protein [Pseudomonadota bacterium]